MLIGNRGKYLGIVFGILFGAANAYLGLRAGLTVSTSIPVAVMTVAMFRLLGRFGHPGTILEANLSQTTGSASSSLASGVIFRPRASASSSSSMAKQTPVRATPR